MIAERSIGKRKMRRGRADARPNSLRLVLALLWCFTLFGLMKPSVVGRAAGDALILCGAKLIPSLFPLAAAGSILAGAGVGTRMRALLGRAMGWLGLSSASVVCLLMGLFAGFPVGAIIASSLAENGQIDSEEASRLCCFTNNASAAFLVGTVGSGLFGDVRIGWLLWLAQSLAALTVGALMGRRAAKGRRRTVGEGSSTEMSTAPLGWGSISCAIAGSAQGMLSLAAFVTFFAAFTAFVSEGVHALTASLGIGGAPALIETAVGGLLEISGGMRSTAALQLPRFAKVLVASAVTGWSGLSVYMQVLAAAKGLSDAHTAALPKRLAKAKVASALLTTVYAAVLYGVFIG